MKYICGVLFCTVIVAVAMAQPAYAGFGVSPGVVYNDRLKPGAQYEQEIIVSRSDPYEDLIAIVEPDLGQMRSWFTFEPGLSFLLPSGQERVSMKVLVNVPVDAEFGEYNGVIRIKATPDGEVQGVSVVKGARIDVDLVATEIDVIDLLVRMLDIPDVVVGQPIILEMLLENLGNVVTTPTKVTMQILDLNQQPIADVEDVTFSMIDPYTVRTITADFIHGLEPGEYFAKVMIYLGNDVIREELIAFRVIAAEELPVSGGTEEECDASILDRVGASPVLFFFFDIILVIILIVLGLIVSRRFKKKKQKMQKDMFILVHTGISLVIGVLIVWWGSTREFRFFEDPCAAEKSESVTMIQPDGESSASEEVMGAVAVNPEILQVPPVSVSDEEHLGKYPVYANADILSDILYYAADGEKLSVVEENSQWYRVLIPSGGDGWLLKSSVKDAETTEVN